MSNNCIKNESLPEGFELRFKNEHFRVFYSLTHKTFIVETLSSYIPVQLFIESFQEVELLAKNLSVDKVVFDKRSLQAFHQPTMEWYFVQWKRDMLKQGVSTYRKLLPPEEWFHKCVESGKKMIFEANPEVDFSVYDIKYTNNIGEAIDY